MEFDKLMSGIMPNKPTVYLSVKEDGEGIKTFCNADMKKFPTAYKRQLKAFLEGVIEGLECPK